MIRTKNSIQQAWQNEETYVFYAFCIIRAQNDQVFDREAAGYSDSHKNTKKNAAPGVSGKICCAFAYL